MEAFNKEIEELLTIQAQNSEALRRLNAELLSLNFSLRTDEETLKIILDNKEKNHILYCSQLLSLYKLKNEEEARRKQLEEAIPEVVPLQHRLEELQRCQERQNRMIQAESSRMSAHKERVHQWYSENRPNLFKMM